MVDGCDGSRHKGLERTCRDRRTCCDGREKRPEGGRERERRSASRIIRRPKYRAVGILPLFLSLFSLFSFLALALYSCRGSRLEDEAVSGIVFSLRSSPLHRPSRWINVSAIRDRTRKRHAEALRPGGERDRRPDASVPKR